MYKFMHASSPEISGTLKINFLQMKYLLFILTGLLFFSLTVIVNAQNDDLNNYTKEEVFIFPEDQYNGIEINNQHGDIRVSASNRGTIEVNILITVKEDDDELASEVLERINIRSSQNGQNLYLRTNFEEDFQPNHDFSIQYDIQIPGDKALDLKNRFGDINIHSVTGNQTIKMEYGRLNQKGIAPIDSIDFDLSFVDANLEKINNAELKLYNANAQIKEIRKGVLDGQYCQIDLTDAGELKVTSETSRYKIGSIKNLSLVGKFCFTSVDNLLEAGNIEISNGLLIISSVAPTLKELSVFNSNAPINLTFHKNLSYTLHGEVTNGQFQHYAANQFRVIKELDKISFSGSHKSEPNEASVVLFNENAAIIIEE